MEYIYFARPDSNIAGVNVHAARKTWETSGGRSSIEADVVTGVPDSSISAAIGYAEATGIPYELGLIKIVTLDVRLFNLLRNCESKGLR